MSVGQPTIAAHPSAVHLSLGYKITWGVAALGTSFISGTFTALYPIFYQDYMGLSSGWFTLATTLYAIWNAINDPLFGYISDSTRFKSGRRIPYMRYTAPFLALSFILVWFAPPKTGQEVLFFWMLGAMLLYDTCYTIIGLVYSALLPEVTESDSERNSLQISASLFGLLGLILGFVVPDMVRPRADTSLTLLPLQISMIVIGVLGAIFIIITSLKVKERPEFRLVDKPLSIGKAVRYTFTSKAFIILISANFMSILMQTLVVGLLFYLADYVLKMRTVFILACVFIPLIVGVPATTLIRRKFGVVGAQQILLVVAGVGLILIPIVPTRFILFCLALAGFGLAGPQTLTNILFAQVADEDELRSGARREGAFFGVNALVTKPAQSLAYGLIAFILASSGFVTRRANHGLVFLNQPESVIFGIKILIGLIPGMALILGAGMLHFFPLQGQRLAKMQESLLIMHAEKHQKLDDQQSGFQL
jgi:GPH family glycoside/pentoside/hexuronide:cation symporter